MSILVVPAVSGVTQPSLLTDAMAVFSLFQVKGRFGTTGVVITDNWEGAPPTGR